jgi:hypothetical protein
MPSETKAGDATALPTEQRGRSASTPQPSGDSESKGGSDGTDIGAENGPDIRLVIVAGDKRRDKASSIGNHCIFRQVANYSHARRDKGST